MTTTTRNDTVAQAHARFDDGRFLAALAELIAVPTESHPPEHKDDLVHYCTAVLGPKVEKLGFSTQILDNPNQEHGPVLLATRIEDPAFPTVLVYGHGDVVRAMPERWRQGLHPYRLTVEGDKIYGRGVVDNKGQHLVAIESLAACLNARGRLGFNVKLFIETGEEAGSPGLKAMLQQHREACAADVFIALDGLRQSTHIPELTLGTRGSVTMDLVVNLREGGYHSGHWGGLLKDPAVILSHAIASIVSRDGRILVPGWTPAHIPDSVRQACARIRVEEVPGTPRPDDGWGEPGMTRAERIFMWSSVIVLAMVSGQPESPVNAVAGYARATIQIRHTVDIDGEAAIEMLQQYLRDQGFDEVEVRPMAKKEPFPASRTDADDPWVTRVRESMITTTGREPNVVPNIGASGPSELFREALGTSVIWIPFSYGGCSQHGPDEHGLGSLFREGLGIMTGIWWDIGDAHGWRADARPDARIAGEPA